MSWLWAARARYRRRSGRRRRARPASSRCHCECCGLHRRRRSRERRGTGLPRQCARSGNLAQSVCSSRRLPGAGLDRLRLLRDGRSPISPRTRTRHPAGPMAARSSPASVRFARLSDATTSCGRPGSTARRGQLRQDDDAPRAEPGNGERRRRPARLADLVVRSRSPDLVSLAESVGRSASTTSPTAVRRRGMTLPVPSSTTSGADPPSRPADPHGTFSRPATRPCLLGPRWRTAGMRPAY